MHFLPISSNTVLIFVLNGLTTLTSRMTGDSNYIKIHFLDFKNTLSETFTVYCKLIITLFYCGVVIHQLRQYDAFIHILLVIESLTAYCHNMQIMCPFYCCLKKTAEARGCFKGEVKAKCQAQGIWKENLYNLQSFLTKLDAIIPQIFLLIKSNGFCVDKIIL